MYSKLYSNMFITFLQHLQNANYYSLQQHHLRTLQLKKERRTIDGCYYQEKMETQLSPALVVVVDLIWASHTEDTIVEPIQH